MPYTQNNSEDKSSGGAREDGPVSSSPSTSTPSLPDYLRTSTYPTTQKSKQTLQEFMELNPELKEILNELPDLITMLQSQQDSKLTLSKNDWAYLAIKAQALPILTRDALCSAFNAVAASSVDSKFWGALATAFSNHPEQYHPPLQGPTTTSPTSGYNDSHGDPSGSKVTWHGGGSSPTPTPNSPGDSPNTSPSNTSTPANDGQPTFSAPPGWNKPHT